MSDERTTPRKIEQNGPRELRIEWADGESHSYDVVLLRRACRCAICIDEWSGEQILRPEQVSEDVRPVAMRPVGRYAIQIDWSDGHGSGIYTFDHLRAIGDR